VILCGEDLCGGVCAAGERGAGRIATGAEIADGMGAGRATASDESEDGSGWTSCGTSATCDPEALELAEGPVNGGCCCTRLCACACASACGIRGCLGVDGSCSGEELDVSASSGGTGLAMPVPGLRIGNSSSFDVVAMPVPGTLIGNSSSSTALGIGIGPEMVPRMDLWPVFGRPAFEPLFQIGMVPGGQTVVPDCRVGLNGKLAARSQLWMREKEI
jgi:hypothetical protein